MKLIFCESCDSEFKIKHSMDSSLYKIEFCPFCGNQINNDEEYIDEDFGEDYDYCLLYTSPSPRDDR